MDSHEHLKEAAEELKKELDKKIDEICSGLDELINKILHHPDISNISDIELENLCLRIPAELYRIESYVARHLLSRDLAEFIEKKMYDFHFVNSQGTIALRESLARNKTVNEKLKTILSEYAYSRLKMKSVHAEKVYDAVRKILTFRMNMALLSGRADR